MKLRRVAAGALGALVLVTGLGVTSVATAAPAQAWFWDNDKDDSEYMTCKDVEKTVEDLMDLSIEEYRDRQYARSHVASNVAMTAIVTYDDCYNNADYNFAVNSINRFHHRYGQDGPFGARKDSRGVNRDAIVRTMTSDWFEDEVGAIAEDVGGVNILGTP